MADRSQDFGGVVLTEEEGNRIGAAMGESRILGTNKSDTDAGGIVGPEAKAMILQNHGLLTVGTTVEEASFLMTLLERACQTQLLVEAAAANGMQKIYIPEKSAKYTFDNSSDAETLYWEGHPDLECEAAMCKGEYQA